MGFWDEFEGDYEGLFDKDPMYQEALDTMLKLAGDLSGKRVLDLGCGAGVFLSRLAEAFPAAELYGVDPSEKMVQRCERRFRDNGRVHILQGSAMRIPLPAEHVHVVLSNLALHHVLPSERPFCAREIVRVLQTGGRLVYADMFCDVEGPPEDPDRCRDIIRKMVGKSLYDLDHGAYRTMLLHLGDLPAVLREEGEYFTTDRIWRQAFLEAGLHGLEVLPVPPAEFGYRIITGVKKG
ncbi:class I SAM-dependent methyltransferase [Candidatus Solincola sp.]|nr:methyltransferase domain-containing protein [Actinomycetota bacterium]MDI7251137.1 methyltransferase domain-containing protein [Actinomycetota bacterium]